MGISDLHNWRDNKYKIMRAYTHTPVLHSKLNRCYMRYTLYIPLYLKSDVSSSIILLLSLILQ